MSSEGRSPADREAEEMSLNLETLQQERHFSRTEAAEHLRSTAATLFGHEGFATSGAHQLMAQLVRSVMEYPPGTSRSAALKYFELMAQTMRDHGPGEPAHYAFEQLLDDAEEGGEQWALEIGQVFKRRKRSGT
jgi:hypothetical protein